MNTLLIIILIILIFLLTANDYHTNVIAEPGMNYQIIDSVYEIPRHLVFRTQMLMLSTNHMDGLYKLTDTVTQLFYTLKIPIFAIGGSLISVLRHNAFMPWDDDADFGYKAEYTEKIRNTYEKLNSLGYNLYESIPGFVIQSNVDANICMDLFSVMIDQDEKVYRYNEPNNSFGVNNMFPKEYYYKDEIENLEWVKLCDLDVLVPSNSIEIIKRSYSKTVMEEVYGVPSTRLHQFRRIQFLLPIIQKILPDIILNPIAKFFLS